MKGDGSRLLFAGAAAQRVLGALARSTHGRVPALTARGVFSPRVFGKEVSELLSPGAGRRPAGAAASAWTGCPRARARNALGLRWEPGSATAAATSCAHSATRRGRSV